MKTPIPDYLHQILEGVRADHTGSVSDYIPDLAEADPELLGVAVCTISGHVYGAGDDEAMFSMQSISKAFVYALALQELGREKVFGTVGMEPSGEAFNELSLEGETHRPMNPMINAGAIAVNQLINGEDSSVEDRVEVIRSFFSDLAGRELQVNEHLANNELEHADRNLAIAHMLRGHDVIHDNAHEAVTSYISQCAIEVNVRDLAVMSATLANGGVQPVTGQEILDQEVCRLTQSVMSSAGMYDGAGRWMATVGIPAKSGVSGGLIGTLPGQLGIATLSPRLNKHGNSVRGVEIFQRLSEDMGLHLMAADPAGTHAVRSIQLSEDDSIINLQGPVNFTAAENILHELEKHDFTGRRLILDVSRVSGFHRMGRKMVKEGLRRIREEGFEVAIYDPEDVMADFEFSDGTRAPEIERR